MKNNQHKIISLLIALALLISMIPAAAIPAEAAETRQGTFTAVTMNVDGLPNTILKIPINPDGPGSVGTKKISAKMAQYGWDIIGVAEDFNFNTELLSSLTSYNSGTHRGGVSGLSNDTDGLNLIWKNTLTTTDEKWVSWNTHYSTGIFGTGNGADGMIDKGYRYYQVTVAEGVNVDVYILHMDADSDAGDIAARESQLTQLANAIKASNNSNPIIVMGDTNCRYTRENLKTLFIDAINADSRFTIQDAWIEKVREGDYPVYGSEAIVAKDKGGTYDYPQAEIVDKVFYINNSDSDVTLTANSYTVATDFTDTDGTALADHWPVVVQFAYSVSVAEHVHSYTETITTEPGCVTPGVKTYTCSCGDSYTEEIPATGHTAVTVPATEPSCTEAGHTQGEVCSVCHAVLVPSTEIPALRHDYQETARREATCTVDGAITYTCSRCGDSYETVLTASGHHFVNGVCEVCGESEVPAVSGKTLGAETKTITSGQEYVVVFTGSTGAYEMSRNGTSITAESFDLKQGDLVEESSIWTITEKNGKYIFSTEIDGVRYYLYRSKSFTGSGYKIALTTSESSATAWTVSTDNSKGTLRFYVQPGFALYYLRYYNERIGWQASLSAAGVHLYQVVNG